MLSIVLITGMRVRVSLCADTFLNDNCSVNLFLIKKYEFIIPSRPDVTFV